MNYRLIIIQLFLVILVPICFANGVVGKGFVLRETAAAVVSMADGSESEAPRNFCAMSIPSYQLRVGNVTTLQDGQYQIDAPRMEGAFQGQVKLFGGVTMQQGMRSIVAPIVDLEIDSGMANFDNGIEITSPGILLRGEEATLETGNNLLRVGEPRMFFRDSGIRLKAESMSQEADSDLILSKAQISTCDPLTDTWSLTASRMRIDDDAKKGVARNLVLRLRGIPILYTPFMPIPMSTQQKGGFSFPSVGFSSEDGLELGLPYEFSWSDENSLSVTPRVISKRGAGFKAVASFGDTWHKTEIAGGYVYRDRLFNGNLSREEYYRNSEGYENLRFVGVDRWSGRISHQGQLGYFETEVDHNFISDQDYFRDVSSSYSGIDRDALSKYARVGFSYHEFKLSVLTRDFEIIDPISRPGYRLEPEFAMEYDSELAGSIDMNLSYRSAKFSNSSEYFDGQGLSQVQRDHFEANFSVPFRNRLGIAKIETGYRYSHYDLEDGEEALANGSKNSLSRGIGFFSFDLATYFEKEVTWWGQELIHSFEPQAYYLVQEYQDQSSIPLLDTTPFFYGYSQLFRRDRFTGIDRIADANDLTIGVTSSLNDQRSGREITVLRLGRTSQFKDRRVGLDEVGINRQLDEAFSGDLSLVLNDRLRSVIGFVWDDKGSEWNQSSLHMNYMGNGGEILNVGFRKLFAESIEQTDISWVWPIKNKASIFGRWSFDWNRSRTLDSFLGIQYDNCCLEVKLGYRKSLDIPASRYYALPQSDESILLQLNFKGFADFGSRVDSIMRQGIRGYADR